MHIYNANILLRVVLAARSVDRECFLVRLHLFLLLSPLLDNVFFHFFFKFQSILMALLHWLLPNEKSFQTQIAVYSYTFLSSFANISKWPPCLYFIEITGFIHETRLFLISVSLFCQHFEGNHISPSLSCLFWFMRSLIIDFYVSSRWFFSEARVYLKLGFFLNVMNIERLWSY